MSRNYNSIIFAISIIILIFFVYLFWDYSIDDAFITFRYAENLADGFGLTFNQGDPAIEGYSNFLWLLILAVFYKIGLSTYPVAKLLGVLFYLITGVIWLKNSDKLNFKYSNWIAPIFLITPISALWAVSGLEVGLYIFLLSCLALAIIKNSPWSYLWLPMVVFVRPEGFAVALVMLAAGIIADRKKLSIDRQYYLVNIIIIIGSITIITLLRLIVFGYPLPNTVYAKAILHRGGFIQLAKNLLFYLPLSLLFLLGIFKILYSRRFEKSMIVFISAFAAQAIISCLANPVMNFHFRYLAAFFPFFAAGSMFALSTIKNPKFRAVLLTLSIISLFIPIIGILTRLNNEREIMAAQSSIIDFINNQPEEITISMTDMGRVPYYTNAKYYDLWGLTSGEVARHGFDALNEFLRFPDMFIFVGYMDGGKAKLRFGTERMIKNHKFFDLIYDYRGAGVPEYATLTEEGYYYLAYGKNRQMLDSLLSLYPIKK